MRWAIPFEAICLEFVIKGRKTILVAPKGILGKEDKKAVLLADKGTIL